jgi:hypothetical protein
MARKSTRRSNKATAISDDEASDFDLPTRNAPVTSPSVDEEEEGDEVETVERSSGAVNGKAKSSKATSDDDDIKEDGQDDEDDEDDEEMYVLTAPREIGSDT